MSGGKPRGLNAARKLRTNRKNQKWSDLAYKKRALGTSFKYVLTSKSRTGGFDLMAGT